VLLKQIVNGSVIQSECLSHCLVGDFASDHIRAQFDLIAFPHGAFPSFVGDFNSIGKGCQMPLLLMSDPL